MLNLQALQVPVVRKISIPILPAVALLNSPAPPVAIGRETSCDQSSSVPRTSSRQKFHSPSPPRVAVKLPPSIFCNLGGKQAVLNVEALQVPVAKEFSFPILPAATLTSSLPPSPLQWGGNTSCAQSSIAPSTSCERNFIYPRHPVTLLNSRPPSFAFRWQNKLCSISEFSECQSAREISPPALP